MERALRPDGFGGDPSPYFLETISAVFDHAAEFDVIHSHLEWWSLSLGRVLDVPARERQTPRYLYPGYFHVTFPFWCASSAYPRA